MTTCHCEVTTKLQFVDLPPSTIKLNDQAANIVVLNCTASVAPGLPMARTQWSIARRTTNQASCATFSESTLSFLSNGTIIIKEAKYRDAGVYTCSAQFDGETITTSTEVAIVGIVFFDTLST